MDLHCDCVPLAGLQHVISYSPSRLQRQLGLFQTIPSIISPFSGGAIIERFLRHIADIWPNRTIHHVSGIPASTTSSAEYRAWVKLMADTPDRAEKQRRTAALLSALHSCFGLD